MRTSRKLLVVGILAAFVAIPAEAGAATPVSFFSGGTGVAAWETFLPAPPGATDTDSIKLQLLTGTDYAGVSLGGLAGPTPSTPPSFDYFSDRSGPSGGSPRLVMSLSDGGRGELRPLTLAAGSWFHEDGATNDWDGNGGPCGFQYEVSYTALLACHPGATVTSVSVVNDSAWIFTPSADTIHIDNIRFGAAYVHQQLSTRLVASPVIAQVLPGLQVYLGNLTGTLTDSTGAPIAGETITFSAAGRPLCSAVTAANGVAVCSGLGQSLSALLGLGYVATFAGDGTYSGTSAKGAVLGIAAIRLF